MYAVVVKPVKVHGTDYPPGQLLDVSDFPKALTLINARILRHATVDEVQKATGFQFPAAETPKTKKGSEADRVPAKGSTAVSATKGNKPELPPLKKSKAARHRAEAR